MKAKASETKGVETRSPELLVVKPSDVKVVSPRPQDVLPKAALLAAAAKSKPPQSWYEETDDPFA